MSATAIKSPSQHSHSHSHSQSRSSRPSTTPRALPHSVGQPKTPVFSPRNRSPPHLPAKSPSPSYFGFVAAGDDSNPPDSNPGLHTKQNWTFATPAPAPAQSAAAAFRHVPNESNPDLEAFRKQSEQKSFSLHHTFSNGRRPSQSRAYSAQHPSVRNHTDPPVSPHSRKPLERSEQSFDNSNNKSFFDIPRYESPVSITANHNVAEHNSSRLSLPVNDLHPPTLSPRKPQRSDTIPGIPQKHTETLASPAVLVDLLQQEADILLLDLRVYQQYASARIKGALNLCIPTTLLKRPSFTIQKLSETFSSDHDRELFDRWRECKYIVVYDANSSQQKEAVIPFNVLKKFTSEGWEGTGLVLKGGFVAFSRFASGWVDRESATSGKGSPNQPLSISPPSQDVLPVAGGCCIPDDEPAAKPFFGNIRQNMDLLDGVGQVPISKPEYMSEQQVRDLPSWLKEAARPSDEGKLVSDRFLDIERSEQTRMQTALTAQVSYGTPGPNAAKKIQVAGIEKGSKNRYNNIFPFDHSRVHLQGVPKGGCDYVNASYVQAQYSNRHYIATQAPVPATFNDFWRVVWEQDVRVIVMLTAETEGGQVKSHPYWNSGEYGPLKLKKLSERQTSIEAKRKSSVLDSSKAAMRRPSLGQRRSTTNNLPDERKSANEVPQGPETSTVTVRTFTLSHSSFPFQPMREIVQLQYTQWPDFGAPASPTVILGLIELVNKYARGTSSPSKAYGADEAEPEGQRPIIVHCSAGCGRTGTFCTIDSVIDMLKRQKVDRDDDVMDMDENDWVKRDDEDLVAKTVEDFRNQRLSMVQNLRQFVLCYESILQWLVQQQPPNEPDRPNKGKNMVRRSSQG